MRALALIAALTLAACASRPLTPSERAFTATVHGPALDTGPVTITRGAVVGLLPATVPVRPRTTCRELIHPPIAAPVQGTFPAMALKQGLYYSRPFFDADFLKGYPDALDLTAAMRLAHELTHIWQWQNRADTGYHPFRATGEHVRLDDPYLTEIDPGRAFLDYGFEQQGVIVEEFVCCRALDPDGARTEDLHRLVTQVFPAAERRERVRRDAVRLPWSGAETRGICS